MVVITNDFASYSRNFGNKLFTYSVSRIISEFYNYRLVVPKNSKIIRDGVLLDFPYNTIEGDIVNTPEYYVSDHSMVNQGIEKIIEESENKLVKMDGYFLKFDYIKDYKLNIKNYYKDLIGRSDNKNDVVILLRDSNNDSTFKLPDSYYINTLKNLTFDNLYLSFDHKHKHQSLFDKLEIYNPIYLDLNILELFKFITTKKTIIGCQGTFSFWGCFLSNAETIYWPITNIGPNKETDPNINLKVTNEKRYQFIKVKI